MTFRDRYKEGGTKGTDRSALTTQNDATTGNNCQCFKKCIGFKAIPDW